MRKIKIPNELVARLCASWVAGVLAFCLIFVSGSLVPYIISELASVDTPKSVQDVFFAILALALGFILVTLWLFFALMVGVLVTAPVFVLSTAVLVLLKIFVISSFVVFNCLVVISIACAFLWIQPLLVETLDQLRVDDSIAEPLIKIGWVTSLATVIVVYFLFPRFFKDV